MDLPGKSPGGSLACLSWFRYSHFFLIFFCSKDKQETPGTSNRIFVLFAFALSSHCFLVPEILYKKKKNLAKLEGKQISGRSLAVTGQVWFS